MSGTDDKAIAELNGELRFGSMPLSRAAFNLQRSHQGYRLKGRTPAQALRGALHREELSASCR